MRVLTAAAALSLIATYPALAEQPFSGVECTTHEYVNEVVSRCEVRINRDQMDEFVRQMEEQIRAESDRMLAELREFQASLAASERERSNHPVPVAKPASQDADDNSFAALLESVKRADAQARAIEHSQ